MRASLACLAILLVAGCSSPADEDPAPAERAVPEERLPTVEDALTAKLHPASGPFFPDMWVEDRVDLPGGGNITLATGLGIRCEGNATPMAPNGTTGWVTCSLRLVSDPTALVVSVRQFELGFDYQPLSRLTPAEPVEWRVTVELDATPADAVANATVDYDSGWRPVDLTARVLPPQASVAVVRPCDAPDEGEPEPFPGREGLAWLNVSFVVESHAQVRMQVRFGGSVLYDAPQAYPTPKGNISAELVDALFPSWGNRTTMGMSVPVDLETDATPGSAVAGPCPGAFARETQVWTVQLDYVGADGKGGSYTLEVPVDVYLAPPEVL